MRIRNDLDGMVLVGDWLTGFQHLAAGDLVPDGVKVHESLLGGVDPATLPPVKQPPLPPEPAPKKPAPVAVEEPTTPTATPSGESADMAGKPAAKTDGGVTVPGKPGRRRKAEASGA